MQHRPAEVSNHPSQTCRGTALLAGVAMSYGWGWRGVYGHEAGAMVPGALLGLAICLGSGRLDWYRRAAVAGMCGAIGWCWGGTLTNMEHRLYIVSGTPIDVIYGFFCIGLVGLLWSGVGGAILAMAFTRPRSELNRFMGPVIVMGGAFLTAYLYLTFHPEVKAAYEKYTESHWHDGEWLSALILLVVMVPYWLLRKQDRPATQLFLKCTVAWWIGYLGLTKFGGIELAPPYRSESWGGVVGVQIALIWHHHRNRDRAAIMFTLYAMLAGCIGFILALQIHVPFVMDWGVFAEISAWKHAEESFGFFMGFGVALGASRLVRGQLTVAKEDADRSSLNLFSIFVLLIVMMWMNLKNNVRDWGNRYNVLPTEPFSYFKEPFPQFEAWQYFFAVGVLWTVIALYCLQLLRHQRLALVPKTPFEKGALIFILILSLSLAAAVALRVTAYADPSAMMSGISLMTLAGIAVWLLMARSSAGQSATEPEGATRLPSDRCWKVGWKYWVLWAWVPVHILIASAIAVGIVDEPWRKDQGKERHRFGPNATWRLELQKQQAEQSEPSAAHSESP